jgi:tetratricopeptide (TPR) repeat protein
MARSQSNQQTEEPREPAAPGSPMTFTLGAAGWYVVMAAAALVVGVTLEPSAPEFFAVLACILVLALAPIGILGVYRTMARRSDAGVEGKIDRMVRSIDSMCREQGLSEGAKRVLHRREERELLRRAIEQDIQAEDWDAAMVLVKELAERFGYRADAEEFRARVERVRAQNLDRKVIDALTSLDDMIRNLQWAEAYAEAARINRLYPESHRVDGLRDRVDEARKRYRQELERKFLLAAQRDQVDQAMTMLKELDQYLTPAEGEQFQEVARGVISKSRENLGVRFKLMVQDHQWQDAIIVGEQIIAEFPNTRMAQEVRDLLPVLRERVAAGAAAR